MHLRPLAFSLLILTVIVLLLGSCDSQVTETQKVSEIQMTWAPITYVSNSAKTSFQMLSEMKNKAPYYCLVSTLNPETEEWAYSKQRFDVAIPNGLVKQAQKQGKDKKWVTYQFADKYALARTNADTLDGGGLVRMARCRLPATPKVINAVKRQLTKFKQTSWVHDKTSQKRAHSSKGNLGPVQTGWEWGCTKVIKWYLCPAGTQNHENNPECTFLYSECYEYGYTYVEEEGPPGGGGGGSDDGDPCEPCIEEPGGSSSTLCENQPGGGDGVPQGCAVEEDIEIVEPCDTNGEYPVLDDLSFQTLMQEAADASGFGESEDNRLESWYVIKEQNGSYTKELVPYTEGSRTSCSYQINTTSSFFNNAIALIHTHPYAPDDMVYNQACLDYRDEDGPMQYTFDGPSQFDVDIANTLSLDLYTMDYENIHFTDKNDIMTGQADKIERCGY